MRVNQISVLSNNPNNSGTNRVSPSFKGYWGCLSPKTHIFKSNVDRLNDADLYEFAKTLIGHKPRVIAQACLDVDRWGEYFGRTSLLFSKNRRTQYHARLNRVMEARREATKYRDGTVAEFEQLKGTDLSVEAQTRRLDLNHELTWLKLDKRKGIHIKDVRNS